MTGPARSSRPRRARLLLAAALLLPALAGARDWQVDPGTSTLGFRAEAQGESFDARFGRFEARIRFDPAVPEAGRFEVEIALDSVDSRNSERDDLLAEAGFFDSRRSPRARWQAERIERLPDGRFRADGELTLRGVTRPVPLTFAWQPHADGATLAGGARIDRLAFGVGDGEWADPELIGREVEVVTTLDLRAPGG
jgi:polyisoprenoid-binding protein YceI